MAIVSPYCISVQVRRIGQQNDGIFAGLGRTTVSFSIDFLTPGFLNRGILCFWRLSVLGCENFAAVNILPGIKWMCQTIDEFCFFWINCCCTHLIVVIVLKTVLK